MNAHALLLDATGLNLDDAVLERALDARMKRLGLADRDAYLALLGGEELNHLIELVVVPESWMFRDPAAFNAALSVVAERLEGRPGQLARVLSLPCAGGEEPYSMAMTVLDAGLPLDRCRIDAADLSAVSIARARAGRYTRNAFRGGRLDFRDRYFTPEDGGYLLREDVRAAVRFSQDNLFAIDLEANAARYDVIFCRNLLIYFDDASIARAASVLGALLAEDGILLAGPSESHVLSRHGFTHMPLSGAFALRRARSATVQAAPVPTPAVGWAFMPTRLDTRPVQREVAPVPCTDLLARAQHCADTGLLHEAAEICRTLLDTDPTAPGPYFILGLVSQSAHDKAGAARHLRQCVYLDPQHYEGLCALALLAEQSGEPDKAALYRQRAARSHNARQARSAA
jgi:chemotaxis protein methyltransferase WspC